MPLIITRTYCKALFVAIDNLLHDILNAVKKNHTFRTILMLLIFAHIYLFHHTFMSQTGVKEYNSLKEKENELKKEFERNKLIVARYNTQLNMVYDKTIDNGDYVEENIISSTNLTRKKTDKVIVLTNV